MDENYNVKEVILNIKENTPIAVEEIQPINAILSAVLFEHGG